MTKRPFVFSKKTLKTPPIDRCTLLAALFFLLGALVRLWGLGSVPGGINQDEAFAGYEALSLLHSGTDSFGYRFPVYLTTWGSGMNALNTYLMIPFLAVFGAHTWVIRLPQALTAIFSLLAAWKLLQICYGQRAALIGLLYLAICPWHITISRWGMESNLAPGFLLFGLCFFVLGAQRPRFLPLSALFYGLSLYCYATIWPIVPLMLFLQWAYLVYTGCFHWDRNAFLSLVILALFAAPLLLFLLVNQGVVPEICTPFFSVPRLLVMRDSEISFQGMLWKLKHLLTVLVKQDDGYDWNASARFGLYYRWALPFGIIGLLSCLKRAWTSLRSRKFDGCAMLLIPFFCAVLLGSLITVNVNRINCIHLPVILFVGIGIYCAAKWIGRFFPQAGLLSAVLLLLCLVSFERYYFGAYRDTISENFQEGLEDAVEYAMALAGDDGEIDLVMQVYHPKILFYSRIPVTTYRDTVVFRNYPDAFLIADSFGPFRFVSDPALIQGQTIPEPQAGRIYLIPADYAETYETAGFRTQVFVHAAVAY